MIGQRMENDEYPLVSVYFRTSRSTVFLIMTGNNILVMFLSTLITNNHFMWKSNARKPAPCVMPLTGRVNNTKRIKKL